jgi:hypothetical protein
MLHKHSKTNLCFASISFGSKRTEQRSLGSFTQINRLDVLRMCQKVVIFM